MKISAVIISFNEEKNIESAIRSVDWADEVLVVDSESTDQTREIAGRLGAKVIVRPWPGFAQQKQFATDAAENDWIFSLDADERMTPRLRDEILELERSNDIADGYRVRRLSYYMGRPIRHSGWYPDRQLRFFDRRKASWKKQLIHESVVMVSGSATSDLDGDIEHFSVDNAAHHHKMIGERYAPLSAQQMFNSGRRTTPLKVAFVGPAAFLRSFILRLGFLDGLPGFCIARFGAYHAFLKHLLLWELQTSAKNGGQMSPPTTKQD